MGGLTYIGEAAIAVAFNTRLLVRLLGLDDLTNGVVLWEISRLATAIRLDAAPLRDAPVEGLDGRLGQHEPTRRERLVAEASAAASSTGTVHVESLLPNVPITQLAKLNVPQGTKTAILRYLVSTEEYPNYVLQQGRFDDKWGVEVRDATGGMLFSISRGINSQLHGPPALALRRHRHDSGKDRHHGLG